MPLMMLLVMSPAEAESMSSLTVMLLCAAIFAVLTGAFCFSTVIANCANTQILASAAYAREITAAWALAETLWQLAETRILFAGQRAGELHWADAHLVIGLSFGVFDFLENLLHHLHGILVRTIRGLWQCLHILRMWRLWLV